MAQSSVTGVGACVGVDGGGVDDGVGAHTGDGEEWMETEINCANATETPFSDFIRPKIHINDKTSSTFWPF